MVDISNNPTAGPSLPEPELHLSSIPSIQGIDSTRFDLAQAARETPSTDPGADDLDNNPSSDPVDGRSPPQDGVEKDSKPAGATPDSSTPSTTPSTSGTSDQSEEVPPVRSQGRSQQDLQNALDKLESSKKSPLPEASQQQPVQRIGSGLLGDFVVSPNSPSAVVKLDGYYRNSRYNPDVANQISSSLSEYASLIGGSASIQTESGFRFGLYAQTGNAGDGKSALNTIDVGFSLSWELGRDNRATPANNSNQILSALRNENIRIDKELLANLKTYNDDPPMRMLSLQAAAEQYSIVAKRALQLHGNTKSLNATAYALVQDELTSGLRGVLAQTNVTLASAKPDQQQVLAGFFAGTPLAPMLALAIGNSSNSVTATSLSGSDPALASQQILGDFMSRSGMSISR